MGKRLNSVGNMKTTKSHKTAKRLEVKKEIIEHLWKIIISDQNVDHYESNLMRRICGLIYFPDKLCGEIKLKVLKSN